MTTTRSSRSPTRGCRPRLIPAARLHVYHGGHLGILTEADELAPVIDAFLNEHSLDEETA